MCPIAAPRLTCAEAGYTTLRLATTAGTAGRVDAYGRNAGPSFGSNHGRAIAESDTGICLNRCEPVAQISKHPLRARESTWDCLSRTARHEESPSPMSLDTAVPPPVAREVAHGLPPGFLVRHRAVPGRSSHLRRPRVIQDGHQHGCRSPLEVTHGEAGLRLGGGFRPCGMNWLSPPSRARQTARDLARGVPTVAISQR